MTPDPIRTEPDRFANVQAVIDGFDAEHRRVLLIRLAMKLNNGDAHFDHGEPGYSWLCLRCAQNGKGGGMMSVAEFFA